MSELARSKSRDVVMTKHFGNRCLARAVSTAIIFQEGTISGKASADADRSRQKSLRPGWRLRLELAAQKQATGIGVKASVRKAPSVLARDGALKERARAVSIEGLPTQRPPPSNGRRGIRAEDPIPSWLNSALVPTTARLDKISFASQLQHIQRKMISTAPPGVAAKGRGRAGQRV